MLGQLVWLNIPDANLISPCIQDTCEISTAAVRVRNPCWEGYPIEEAQILEEGEGLRRSQVVGKSRHVRRDQQT
jgi:hypothetical protein